MDIIIAIVVKVFPNEAMYSASISGQARATTDGDKAFHFYPFTQTTVLLEEVKVLWMKQANTD